jgi:3-hydroxyisobutyrate dehydrogenase
MKSAPGGTMTKVGFIGIGTMGTPMSANLVKKGFEVTVFDAAPGRAAEAAKEIGAKPAAELSGLGDCEFIVTMLPDGHVVADVLTKAEGEALIKSCAKGTIFIDMSSSEPLITRQTGAALADHGLILVDAPVSGGRPRAEAGTLALMIGAADEASIAKARPVLEAMGNQLFVMGGLGNGHAMKCLNNMVGGVAVAATYEALLIGEKFGLDPKLMTDVINASTGRSFASEVVVKEHALSGKFATGFAMGLLAKDVRIAADLASGIGARSPYTNLTRDEFAHGRDKLGFSSDISELLLVMKNELSD